MCRGLRNRLCEPTSLLPNKSCEMEGGCREKLALILHACIDFHPDRTIIIHRGGDLVSKVHFLLIHFLKHVCLLTARHMHVQEGWEY